MLKFKLSFRGRDVDLSSLRYNYTVDLEVYQDDVKVDIIGSKVVDYGDRVAVAPHRGSEFIPSQEYISVGGYHAIVIK